ncbi:hypothetical protein M1437_00685 [Patescibacteria group bacterium]|nr:hypothetical protein [Patescibacteria group bacterium]
MSPENARLLIAEDDLIALECLTTVLNRGGFQPVAIATNMQEAKAAIPTLLDKGVEVALVDGNLGPGISNADGEILTETIHRQAPGIVVVGIPSFGEISGADHHCDKTDFRSLLDTIRNI